MDKFVNLIGIPFDGKSSYLGGAGFAPERLRKEMSSSAYNMYCERRFPVLGKDFLRDCGDLKANSYEKMLPVLRTKLNADESFVFIGGDHSVTFPIVEAMNEIHGKFHILHFDAHGDLYDEFEGDPHSHACPFARIMENGLVETLTQVGVRSLTPHQFEQAEKYNVEVYEMRNIAHFDPSWVEGPLYISLDLDVLDPAYAPGVSHREPGGVSPRMLIDWLHEIKVPVIGADIVEYNPLRDVGDVTASVAYKILKELLGVFWNEEEFD